MSDEEIRDDDNVYSAESREELVEDDAMTPEEEGFMEGADGDGQEAKCAYCGEALIDRSKIVEEEFDGQVLRFCSDDHAEKYAKKLEE